MLLAVPITLALALTLQGQQPDRKASDPDDPTAPLFRAIALRDVNEVRRTLSTGADVNATNPEGVTPLMRAAMDGEVEIVQTLLAAGGAKVNVQSESGETALLRAAGWKVIRLWESDVKRDVERLRSAPAIPDRVAVSGHVYDVVTGLVETVLPTSRAYALDTAEREKA